MSARKKAYVVTDLGGGDGGKGGVVHALCTRCKPHTVIKVGGAQGSHGVCASTGERFAFSQFGCGTFNGVRTYISDRFVFSPVDIFEEARALRYECGIWNPFDCITVDENALCVTPFHGIASRLRELARKRNSRGTVGTGVGEAFVDSELHPELALRVRDMGRSDLSGLLEAIRFQKILDLRELLEVDFLSEDSGIVEEEKLRLFDPKYSVWIADQFAEVARRVRIVDSGYLREKILDYEGSIVIESSHGILTDRYYGFHPHASRLRTVPEVNAWGMLKSSGYDGKVVNIGVTRAYQIRHGAGPFVTEDPLMTDMLLSGSSKDENRYQGKVRVGPLDCVMLRYAIGVCGGPEVFDGLAVTWFDQFDQAGQLRNWTLCNQYLGATDESFFSRDGEVLIHRGVGNEQLSHQEQLGRLLRECRPILNSFAVSRDIPRDAGARFCAGVLRERIGVPVRIVSFGRTEQEKLFF